MTDRYVFTSLTRISDLRARRFAVQPLARGDWAHGDYVVAEVLPQPPSPYGVELDNGRMIEVLPGDQLVGAFGKRAATLEGVGDWAAIGDDGRMVALTAAGLFGKGTSLSPEMSRILELQYVGHTLRNGNKLTMRDFVTAVPERRFEIPVVLLLGTSMSAGKTTTGRLIVHELKADGLSVAGAKLTGAARYRDVLSFADAGADHIYDFVDAGLPSTVVEPEVYRAAIGPLLSRIAASGVDVLVAEAGASPLEPYNGATFVEMLRDNIRCSVLCASDPYAVLGVQTAFGFEPDLVCGPASNTEAAVALVKKLTGLEALNLLDPSNLCKLRNLLHERLPFRAIRI